MSLTTNRPESDATQAVGQHGAGLSRAFVLPASGACFGAFGASTYAKSGILAPPILAFRTTESFASMNPAITGISSMATRQVLADLAALWQQRSGRAVSVESVGGVDAVRRIEAGEAFDVVVLASDAIDKLIAGGHVVADGKVDLVRSGVAVAVREGDAAPDIGTEAALRQAVQAARSIGYSTGPSGVALIHLFERWGVADAVRSRLVQAPAGVPVAALLARGEVGLGFQQLSELMNVQGVQIVGPLPEAVQITTIFSAGLCAGSPHGAEVRQMMAFMASPAAHEVMRRHGMAPARPSGDTSARSS
jgi:molybdate transport system substrate-binding protein